MLIGFLVVALVAGLALVAVVDGTARRGRGGRRRSGRGFGGRGVGQGGSRQSVVRLDRDQIATRWATIEAMAAGGGNGLRQAVAEADKLLDQAMRQSGLSGDTLGERLKSAKGRFSSYAVYDGLWHAHKLRNALAHEVGFDLVPSQAREALGDFERGLRELGVL